MQIGIGDNCDAPANGVVPSGSGVKPLTKAKSGAKSGAKSDAKSGAKSSAKSQVKKRAAIEESTSEEEYSERDKTEDTLFAERSKNQLDFSSSSNFSSASPVFRTSTPVSLEKVFHPSTDMPTMDRSKSIKSVSRIFFKISGSF